VTDALNTTKRKVHNKMSHTQLLSVSFLNSKLTSQVVVIELD
jgi:hypothetical protein